MKFAKWHGAGNDFLLFMPEDGVELEKRLPQLAPKLCDRHRGIGADGVLFVMPQAIGEIRLLYFNRDGSRASFCANGTRCAAAFAARRLKVTQLSVVTDFAPIPATVHGTSVTLELPPANRVEGWKTLAVKGQIFQAFLVTVGVPHLLVPVTWENFWHQPLASAPGLRHHPTLGEDGANVNFLQLKNGEVWLRTYERGVEGETLACGSGAVAAAHLAVAEGWLSPPVSVLTASERRLTITPLAGPWSNCQLVGPAEPIAAGEVAPELEARVFAANSNE